MLILTRNGVVPAAVPCTGANRAITEAEASGKQLRSGLFGLTCRDSSDQLARSPYQKVAARLSCNFQESASFLVMRVSLFSQRFRRAM